VYSTAAVTLSCFAVSTAIRHLDPRGVVSSSPIKALGLIAVAVALYRLTNRTIVAAAVIASARSATRSDLFGRRSVNALEFSTLALGAVMAGCVARQPWFAVMVLPAVFLLQHHDLLKQLVAAATTDAKTELLNAAAWHKLAGRELGRAERRDETAAVLIVDMDHFKRINDTHGHVVGDHVLRAVGKALADELRGYDAVGRFGGEEFVAMLPDVGTDSAPRVAERVRRRIESLHVPGGARDPDELRLSASVGVALYPYHGTQLDTLIECADEALYLAKDAGRNTVCVAPLGAAVG
jgi:diguanylate cyclase (GGDEF)-like protein